MSAAAQRRGMLIMSRMRKPTMGEPGASEASEQRMLVSILKARGIKFFSVPNEGRHTYAAHSMFKSMGRLTGVPDLIFIDRSPKTGMPVAIEMKSKKGKVRKSQSDVHEMMAESGWHVHVAYGFMDALDFLDGLGFNAK